jgi:protein involved in polysaccharide export with SLBB domain
MAGGLFGAADHPNAAGCRLSSGPGDEINIAVSGEQDLTMRVKIDNSGSVDYPL